MPFEGDCPPGSDKRIVNHAQACVPRACVDDDACGRGAECVTLCVCRGEREVRIDGRVVYPEPRMIEMEVGLCQADGTCGEDTPTERRQCEPDEATPAFDPATHRWTERPHPTAGCSGCAIPRSSGPRGPGLGGLALVGLGLLAARSRRRRARNPGRAGEHGAGEHGAGEHGAGEHGAGEHGAGEQRRAMSRSGAPRGTPPRTPCRDRDIAPCR